MSDYVSPRMLTTIYNSVSDIRTAVNDILIEAQRYPEQLGKATQSGTGSIDILDSIDTELYIQCLHLSAFETGGAQSSAFIRWNPDSGSDEYLVYLEIPANGCDQIVMPFNPPMRYSAAGNIEVVVAGANLAATGVVFGSIEL